MKYKSNLNLLKLLFIVLSLFSIQVYAQSVTLRVGLYPYVPRIEQFQKAIQTNWQAVHPDVKIVFDSDWDGGYDAPPPDDIDVFVFDAIMFDNFRSNGYLEPMEASEIKNLNDFVSYAIKGVQYNDKYYAIPQLGCTNILFYKKDDQKIASVKSINELQSELETCSYTSQIPPDSRGLMLDMKGTTTNDTFYLDIAHSLNDEYPLPLPSKDELSESVIEDMRDLLTMASFENATKNPPKDYGRASWFSDGYGRALVGFTEHMSAMSESTRKNIGFKPLPMYNNGNPPMFYADVIAVNTNSKDRNLSVELANVMASAKTMIASIGADETNAYPQYLMATRPSVFTALGKDFPIYNDMYTMLQDSDPIMFKMPENSREWITNMKNTIRDEVQNNYSCGCDQTSKIYIVDNSAAKDICTATCSSFSGWNGEWTNQQPAAPQDSSVCGCNSCTVVPVLK